MNLNSLRAILMQKPAATEELPFGPDVLVFKVKGKMFALVPWQDPAPSISLKCDPDEAMFQRDIYPAVNPGYHLNKRHWNTVTLDGSVPEPELLRMIDDSYRLVVKGLKKADREELHDSI
jgi:predicted DNA-binding protein (MmcQ/YjbR family)